jgi:hypothetical protein
MKLTRVGVDLAKQVFQVHGVDRAERTIRDNAFSLESPHGMLRSKVFRHD